MQHKDTVEGLWKIPENNGESCVAPAFGLWPQVIHQNQMLLETRFAERRTALRLRLAREAIRFTRDELRDARTAELFSENVNRFPIVVSGHQPRFFHPGVWLKNFLLHRAGQELQVIPINLIVDTDEVGQIDASVPVYQDRWYAERIELISAKPDSTFEDLQAPSSMVVEEFTGALHALSMGKYQAEIAGSLRSFQELVQAEKEIKEQPNLGQWLTMLRRRHEGPYSGYLELPVSRLAEFPEFKEWAAEMINDIDRFTDCYNQTLHQYRLEHGYRYPANPFPDMQRSVEGEYELPLWIDAAGTRHSVHVRVQGEKKLLIAGGEEVISWQGQLVGESLAKVRLRPRGMSLTLFMRLFCADLFLHGIGGAKYDGATNAFIKNFYKIKPPAYVGASLTLFPKLEFPEVSTEHILNLEELLRDIEYNPDRHMDEAGLDEAKRISLIGLVSRKQELIREIKEPAANRKRLGLAIKETNEQIGEVLTDYRKEVELRLAQARQLLAEREQVAKRTFPYFLFSPQRLAKIANCD